MTFNVNAAPFYPTGYVPPVVLPQAKSETLQLPDGSLQGRSVSEINPSSTHKVPKPIAPKPSEKKFVAKHKISKVKEKISLSPSDRLTNYLLKITLSSNAYSESEALEILSKALEEDRDLPKVAKAIYKKIASTSGLKQIECISFISNLLALVEKLNNRVLADSFAEELVSLIPQFIRKTDYPQFKNCYLPLIELNLLLKKTPSSIFLIHSPTPWTVFDQLITLFVNFHNENEFNKFIKEYVGIDQEIKVNPIGVVCSKIAGFLREQENFELLKNFFYKINDAFPDFLDESNSLSENFIALSQPKVFQDILKSLRQMGFKLNYSADDLSVCSDIEFDTYLYLSEKNDPLAARSIYHAHKTDTQHYNLMGLLDVALSANPALSKESLSEKMIRSLLDNDHPLSAYTMWQYAIWNNIWSSDIPKKSSLISIIKSTSGPSLDTIIHYILTSNHFKEDHFFLQSLLNEAINSPCIPSYTLKDILRVVFKIKEGGKKFGIQFTHDLFIKTLEIKEDAEIKKYALNLFSELIQNQAVFSSLSIDDKSQFLVSLNDQPLILIDLLQEINEAGCITEIEGTLEELVTYCAAACLTKLTLSDLKKVFLFLIHFRNFLFSPDPILTCLDLFFEEKDREHIAIISDQFARQEVRQYFSKNISIPILKAYSLLSQIILQDSRNTSQVEKAAVYLFFIHYHIHAFTPEERDELVPQLDNLRGLLLEKWHQLPQKLLTATLGRHIYLMLSDKVNASLTFDGCELSAALKQVDQFILGCIRSHNEALLAIARKYALHLATRIRCVPFTDILLRLISCSSSNIQAADDFLICAYEKIGETTHLQRSELVTNIVKHFKLLQSASEETGELGVLFKQRIDFFFKMKIQSLFIAHKNVDLPLFLAFSKSEFSTNHAIIEMLLTTLRKINKKEWEVSNSELLKAFLSIVKNLKIDSDTLFDLNLFYALGNLVGGVVVFCNSKRSNADLFYKSEEGKTIISILSRQVSALFLNINPLDIKELPEKTHVEIAMTLPRAEYLISRITGLKEETQLFNQALIHTYAIDSLFIASVESILSRLKTPKGFSEYLTEIAQYSSEFILSASNLRMIFNHLTAQLSTLDILGDTELTKIIIKKFIIICVDASYIIAADCLEMLIQSKAPPAAIKIYENALKLYCDE